MYRTIDEGDTITMWDIQHNTLAGDVAVTVFIQVRRRDELSFEKRERGRGRGMRD